MLHRSAATFVWVPMALTVALMFALAPACTMPGCASLMGLAGIIDHGHGCQDYMMVDESPDGLPAPQAPAVAVIPLSDTPEQDANSALAEITLDSFYTAVLDPLGARIRI